MFVIKVFHRQLTLTMENFDYEHLGREEELNLQG